MILLDVQNVRRYFGPEPVLDGVTLEVRAGERVALVGPNGAGKTALLRILAGRDEPDGGSCRLHATVHLGYLEQQPHFEPGRTLWDEAQTALAGLIELEQEALAVAEEIARTTDAAEHDRLAARYDHLQQELGRHDAYNLDHKIERVLQGLGFRPEAFAQEVNSLSGGEQNRLILARLLLSEPNLMLLDEPSNHLDVQATEWLEDFLKESSAAMIVVSHDRCFLDGVATRTLELFRGTVDSFAGNYSAYRLQKQQRLLVQQRTYERQQIEIAKTKDFIRRNAYGQKHAQAEDRRKKLERIELVDRPREIAAPPMGFAKATRSGDIVLRAVNLGKGFGRPLFEGVSFQIERGHRWALLGPNGCGKTTLLSCLVGRTAPDRGQISLGQGVAIGYFDQRLEELDDETPLVDAIRPERKEFNQQQRRDLLARFGLTGDTVLQKVSSLSGGERCRSALARLAAADANFLVLDEPTNHLDLWALDSLEEALGRFEGTVLFVSHDRYFVNRVADHLLVFEADGVRVVEGNYEAYQRLLGRLRAESAAAAARKPESLASRKQTAGTDRSARPSRPKRRFPFRKATDLEEEIIQCETSLGELHEQLARGETYRDGNRVRQLKAEIARVQKDLETLYAHWEEATELNW